MSLSEAVLNTCKSMEAAAEKYPPTDIACFLLQSYARELRNLVEAAKANYGPSTIKAQYQETQNQRRAALEDQAHAILGGSMVLCQGGRNDGVTVPFDPQAPRNGTAKAILEQEVYVLQEDGKLQYSEEETVKYWELRKSKSH